jgi:hypothetical protein
MTTTAHRDNGWRRLSWLLPLALVLWLAALDGFFLLLRGGGYAPPAPKPVDLRIVEVTPPPPPPAEARAPTIHEAAPPPPLEAPAAPVAEAPASPTLVLPAPPPSESPQAPVLATSPPAPAPSVAAAAGRAPASRSAPAAAPPVIAPGVPAAIAPAMPAAPAAPSPPSPAGGARVTAAPAQEVARGASPETGMLTQPLAPAAPLAKEEWDRLAFIHHPGDANGSTADAVVAPERAARSKRTPPLTKQEYARLAKIHRTGDPNSEFAEGAVGPIRAARSERTRPLTKEEYAAQTRIYWTGMNNGDSTPVEREAGTRGALSFAAALATPAAQVDYSGRTRILGDRTAHALAQPPPEIPPGVALGKSPVTVVARFQIAADGSAEATLVSPTPDPRLNDALLAALGNWRFAPAYRAGAAVDSSLDYRLTIAAANSVKVETSVKLLTTERPADFARAGFPAVVLEAPAPELPEALLKPNARWTVVIRVHVATDGTAETTVTQPAADPVVTRALEAVLPRWRFRPTFIRGSLPQDSTVELTVALSAS